MRTDYLTPNLYNKLYALMTYENVLALRVSLETGLRIDDVLSLRADQISKRTITGTAEKTGKKFRKVISTELAKRLTLLTPNKGGFLFPHRTDELRHRTRQAVWSNMKHAAKALGIDMNVAPHSARKTYAVELFKDSGLDTVQKELQHDHLSTTMLYAFSNILYNGGKQTQDIDFSTLAEIIAEKIVQKMIKKGLICFVRGDIIDEGHPDT